MFGVFFYNSLFIQNVLGYSAIETGATFLPMTLLIILVAPSRAVVRPDRAALADGAGMTLLTVSLLLFGRSTRARPSGRSCPASLVGGLGMALTMAPTTARRWARCPSTRPASARR
jgi:hypothetical protein